MLLDLSSSTAVIHALGTTTINARRLRNARSQERTVPVTGPYSTNRNMVPAMVVPITAGTCLMLLPCNADYTSSLPLGDKYMPITYSSGTL